MRRAITSHKTTKPSKARPMNGHLILQFKDGRLTLHPVANSDEEMTDLLSAIRDRIVAGDLWALTVEYL